MSLKIELPKCTSEKIYKICGNTTITPNQWVIEALDEVLLRYQNNTPLNVQQRDMFIAGHKPTTEQEKIINMVKDGKSIILDGPTGTSKTSLLTTLSLTLPSFRSGLLFSSSAEEAKVIRSRFLRNVEIIKQYSIPYRALAHQFTEKPKFFLDKNDIKSICSYKKGSFDDKQIVTAIIKTLENFCFMPDRYIKTSHISLPKFTNKEKRDKLSDIVITAASQYWEQAIIGGSIKVTYSMLMKLWHYSGPIINADVIFIDNAQNFHPLLIDLVMKQKSPKLITYDSYMCVKKNSIDWGLYKNCEVIELRENYRADEYSIKIINAVLRQYLKAPASKCLKKKSCLDPDKKIPTSTNAIICHSVKGLIEECFKAINTGVKFYVLDDLSDLRAFISRLENQGTFQQVTKTFQNYSTILNSFGINSISKLLSLINNADKDNSEFTITTAKTASLLEFDNVILADDFIPFSNPDYTTTDGYLLYIAVSRHKYSIDVSNCTAITRLAIK